MKAEAGGGQRQRGEVGHTATIADIIGRLAPVPITISIFRY